MTECAAKGPYLPAGDVDWTCRVHDVALVVRGDTLACPTSGEVLAVRTGSALQRLSDALDRSLAAANARAGRRFTIDLDDPALRARLTEAVEEMWNRADPSAMTLAESTSLDVDRILAALPVPPKETS